MDYLSKALEDGLVDSSPNCCVIPIAVNSFSPLRNKAMAKSLKSKWWKNNGVQ